MKEALTHLKVIARDAAGIGRVCGWLVALRWIGCIAWTLPLCRRSANLQPADRLMGDGPFLVRRGSARARLTGVQVFSGIREIWVRDVYLKGDYLRVPPGALVVDFGANLGNFTALALAQHSNVRAVAVEPRLSLLRNVEESARLNGWSTRLIVKRAFVGLSTKAQAGEADNPDYLGAPFLTEQQFLDELQIKHIDFLKCDIEGSEFFMIEPDSRLLSIADHLAIEIHEWGGSVPRFLEYLRNVGFDIGSVVRDGTGSCIALCRRPTTARTA